MFEWVLTRTLRHSNTGLFMKVERFEELDCWKVARELVKLVYGVTRGDPFCRDFGLRDQIQRASVSVMANIAEGFATYSDIEFIRFLNYATRSAIEVQSHLYVALDLEYCKRYDFDIVFGKANDCVGLCRGLIRYLKNKT